MISGSGLVSANTMAFGSIAHSDAFLTKIDGNGNMVWFQDLDGSIGHSVQQTDDDGFIVAGVFETVSSLRDLYLVKTDSEGNVEWSLNYDDQHWEVGYSVVQADDGNYVVCGSYSTNFPYSNDVILIKFGDMVPADLTLTATPYNPPIIIPSAGGSFDFNIEVINNEPDAVQFDLWTYATLPGGTQYGPILNRGGAVLAAGTTAARDLTQNVPATAPEGSYTYDVYVGIYPDAVWNEDHFDFSKSAVLTGGSPVIDWDCREIGTRGPAEVVPSTAVLHSASPNPFNPSTVIRYQLSVVSFVNLAVYDLGGRKVADLVNGWRAAGEHEVTFDAAGLAAGVYLCCIDAGDFNAVRKMVLIK